MPIHPSPARRPPSVVRDIWRLGRIYWTSADAVRGGALLALAVALELGTVYGNVQVARAQAALLDVLTERNVGGFVVALGYQLAALVLTLFAATFRIYVRQGLEIRWREHLTDAYLRRWVTPDAYWQAELHGAEMDNPDQRVAEDVRSFVASALGLSLSLLSAVLGLVSFGGMLWSLSQGWPLTLAGTVVRIPGFLMWVAIAYALLARWLTHLVGRKLVPINFDKLRYEADFRYGLVRFRDQVEAVALAHGTDAERRELGGRFTRVVQNWWQLIGAQRNLALLTMGVGQANGVVPVLLAAPAYFAGHLTLGHIAQVRFAYGQVSGALTWFVNAYQEIAQWRASIQRLIAFDDVMAATADELRREPRLEVATDDAGVVALADLALRLPDGQPLLQAATATLAPGERVALVGATGSGRSILLRALAGIWPFGRGRITIPRGARVRFVASRPYLPDGTLRAALCYPEAEGGIADPDLRAALELVGLARFASRLDDREQWSLRLSHADQQRLALARVLVQAPDWVFLDEATSAFDEDAETRAYALLRDRLPGTAVVSISQRPGVVALHERRWTFTPSTAGATLVVA